MIKEKSVKVSKEQVETTLAILTTTTYIEAAAHLGITDDGLRKRRKKYQIDELIDEMPQEALQRLKIGSIRAANTLVSNLDDKTKDMDAANSILDRVGIIKPAATFNQQINSVNIGGDLGIVVREYDPNRPT